MTQDIGDLPTPNPRASEKDVREARRKAALKANMARRKAQVRAREVVADQPKAAGTDTLSGPDKE